MFTIVNLIVERARPFWPTINNRSCYLCKTPESCMLPVPMSFTRCNNVLQRREGSIGQSDGLTLRFRLHRCTRPRPSTVFLPPRRAIASCFHTGRGRNNCGPRKERKKKKKGWKTYPPRLSVNCSRRDECRIVGEGLTEVSGMCFKRLLNDHAFERLIATIA